MGEPLGFKDLVQTLAGMAALMLERAEQAEERPAALAGARSWIDLLGVLETKTQGNRTDEENRVLTAVLTDLRLAYSRAAAAPAQPPEKPASPPDAGEGEETS